MSQGPSGLDAVAMEQEADLFPVMFIDKASYKAVLWTFLTFLFFQSAYVYAGMHSPSLVNATTIDYPLVQPYNNRKADVKIRIAPLSPVQQFLRLDAALSRHSSFRPYSDGIIINTSAFYYAGGQQLDSHVGNPQNHKFHFRQGLDVSNYINILFTRVTNFDAINLWITFDTDLFFSKGFKLTYSFADPGLTRFRNAIRIVLASSAAYTFVGFLLCLKGGVSSNFQRPAIILGVAAVWATNPVGLFLSKGIDDLTTPITVAVFMAVFRWFIIHIIDSLVHEDDAIFRGLAFVYVPALIAYAVIESAAGVLGNGISTDGTRSISIFDNLLIYCHVGYCAIVLIWLAYAYVVTVGTGHFKIVSFGLFTLVTVVMTLVPEVFWRKVAITKGSSLPLLLYQSTHILAAIVFLFFQHSSKGFEDFNFADRRPGIQDCDG